MTSYNIYPDLPKEHSVSLEPQPAGPATPQSYSQNVIQSKCKTRVKVCKEILQDIRSTGMAKCLLEQLKCSFRNIECGNSESVPSSVCL